MSSFSFWVFAVLIFTQKKQLRFLVQDPLEHIFGGFGAITQTNNVRLSQHFDRRKSSQSHKRDLKYFETNKFLQGQGVPKVWVFGPILAELKNSHRAIQISQNQGPISC